MKADIRTQHPNAPLIYAAAIAPITFRLDTQWVTSIFKDVVFKGFIFAIKLVPAKLSLK